MALPTDTMAQMDAICSETLYVSLAMSVLASMGSRGNSAMRRPSLVSSPLGAGEWRGGGDRRGGGGWRGWGGGKVRSCAMMFDARQVLHGLNLIAAHVVLFRSGGSGVGLALAAEAPIRVFVVGHQAHAAAQAYVICYSRAV